jgi:thymidylate synthase (FAD)
MNTVQLLGHYGGDETHALSAWTSTSRDYEKKKHRMPELLKMLAENGHHTPFEKSSLHFLVTCDQASHIHFLKHRIFVSINAESARYKELKEDKSYIPADFPEKWKQKLLNYTQITNTLYHECLEELSPLLGRQRAKESARYFKMFNSQITMDVIFNFRSFHHFQTLRNNQHAQKEIREIAQAMLEQVKNLPNNPFEFTIKAFNL